ELEASAKRKLGNRPRIAPAFRCKIVGMASAKVLPLFTEAVEIAGPSTSFAEVVFDRPLDHAYSYGVPESLREAVEVGKRVMAPFGRGDRQTTGFCVGVSDT